MEAEDVASGISFHAADGTMQTGTGTFVDPSEIIDIVHPVGSIYMSVNSTDPSNLFGGTWEQIQDKFLLAAGSSYAAGSEGGQASVSHAHTMSHTHTEGDLRVAVGATDNNPNNIAYEASSVGSRGPSTVGAYTITGQSSSSSTKTFNHHTRVYGTTETSSSSSTGSTTISTLPPYLAVYIWKRTA